MDTASLEGQGPQRAVEPTMICISCQYMALVLNGMKVYNKEGDFFVSRKVRISSKYVAVKPRSIR
jgi:hypothetical protein